MHKIVLPTIRKVLRCLTDPTVLLKFMSLRFLSMISVTDIKIQTNIYDFEYNQFFSKNIANLSAY